MLKRRDLLGASEPNQLKYGVAAISAMTFGAVIMIPRVATDIAMGAARKNFGELDTRETAKLTVA